MQPEPRQAGLQAGGPVEQAEVEPFGRRHLGHEQVDAAPGAARRRLARPRPRRSRSPRGRLSRWPPGMPKTTSEASASTSARRRGSAPRPRGFDGTGDDRGGRRGAAHGIGHVEQQRQRPLQVGGGELAGVEHVQVAQRALDVPGQEQQLTRADPAAHQRGLVRFRGEPHRLRGELRGRGVCRAGVGGRGGRVQRLGHRAVRSVARRPGPRNARTAPGWARRRLAAGTAARGALAAATRPRPRRSAGARRTAGPRSRPPRRPGPPRPRPRRDRPGGRVRRGRRRSAIRPAAATTASAAAAPPLSERDRRSVRVRASGGTWLPAPLQAGGDLEGPERVAARLPGHLPSLGGGDRPGQQVLDLPHVQRREVDRLGGGQRGEQVTPAVRRRRRAGGQRIRGGLGAGGYQQG